MCSQITTSSSKSLSDLALVSCCYFQKGYTLGFNGEGSSNGTNGNPNLAQLMQAFIVALNANRPPPNNPLGPMTHTQAMNKFCKRRPPVFHNEPNSTLVEAWLKEIKVILSTLGVNQDNHGVALAAYQLEGEARHQWEVIEVTYNIETITFKEFENIFLDKYFLAPVKQVKIQEFQNLQQSSMIVMQYVAKFEELYCYGCATIPTEEDKVRKFEWGLGATCKTMTGMGYATYANVVKCTLRMERDETDFRTRFQGSSSGGPIRTVQNNINRGPHPSGPNIRPTQQPALEGE